MTALDPISREYIGIALGIERLVPGFVDTYLGPEDERISASSGTDPRPGHLLARIEALAGVVEDDGLPNSRRRFLQVHLRAMAITCRRLAGESIDYVEEVRTCFEIEPRFTAESVFESAIAELEMCLPGTGDVPERMAAWQASRIVPAERALPLIELILAETRRRTAEFVSLPPGDDVEIRFVQDKPWKGYNWYLGGNRSRVEVNTDLPIYVHSLVDLMAHEAYPGHHTEHTLKEQVLYRERGFGEHAIQLINTPECLISEGIATLAESIIFPGEASTEWQADVLYPAAGIIGDPERDGRIVRATNQRRAVNANAALLFHAEGRPEAEVIAYMMRYALRGEAEARQSFRFITDPLWRPYTFTYSVGQQLLGDWLHLAPETERRSRFVRLLVEQLTPGEITAEVRAAAAPDA